MLDNRFNPTQVTVPAGSTVTWLNRGSNLHTATSFDGLCESGNLGRDGRFNFTFTEPGTYQYFCSLHPATMRGEIRVT